MKRRILLAISSLLLFCSLFYFSISSAVAMQATNTTDLRAWWIPMGQGQPIVGYEFQYGVSVYNGGADALQNVGVQFYLGLPATGTPIGAMQVITEIPANTQKYVTLQWTPTVSGVVTLTAWIDPHNTIAEVNEQNNQALLQAKVRDAGLTWYVDQNLPQSGDGLTPQSAVRTFDELRTRIGYGDVISVATGIYTSNLTLPKDVSMLGSGRDATVISGSLVMQSGSRLEGVTLDTGSGLQIQGDAHIRHSRITRTSGGIRSICYGAYTGPYSATLEFTIIDRNYSGFYGGNCFQWTIRNSTIVSNAWSGLEVFNAASVVENSIIAYHPGNSLVITPGVTVQHNLIWPGISNSTQITLNQTNVVAEPMFRNLPQADYRLYAGSPAVGNGNPDGADMGALPFVAAGAAPTGITVERVQDYVYQVSWQGNAAPYNLYLGFGPHKYTRRIPVGQVNSYVLSGLAANLDYYVAVTREEAGGESALSDEVRFFVPALEAGRYENSSASLAIEGAWQTLENPAASGGSHLQSSRSGDSIELTFSGDSLVLYRRLGVDGGYASVYIDDIFWGWMSFRFVEERWQVPAIFDNLGAGIHTIRLVVGSPYAASSDGVVSIDAFGIPAGFAPTDQQLRAVERVNYYRQIAGIPLGQGVQSVHAGAQAHAEFYVTNKDDPRMAGLGFHQEHADLPGYVGKWPSDRAAYFGYTGGLGEDGHFTGDAIAGVDGWMETIYHRNLIMCYGCVDIGFGTVNTGAGRADALNMGSRPHTRPPSPAERLIYTYPADGQSEIPHTWHGGEIPDPLPGKPKPVGYPISLYIQQPSLNGRSAAEWPVDVPWIAPRTESSNQWQVTVAELHTAAGAWVPVYMLDQKTDVPKYLGPDNVFLVPEQPLQLNTTYRAHIAGIDSRGVPFDVTWSFTTNIAARLLAASSSPGACGGTVFWTTAGNTLSWLEYGTTTAYGMVASSSGAFRTNHNVGLTGLAPNTTYHFRIVSRDEAGNERSSEDRVFATRDPLTLRVPQDYTSIQSALNTARACDTVQVSAGTYSGYFYVPYGVSLLGAGPGVSVLQGNGQGSVVQMGDQARVSGFSILGSGGDFWAAGIWIGDNISATVSHNRISGNSMGVVNYCFEPACTGASRIYNNLIDNNREDGIYLSQGVTSTIVNNTVVGNRIGVSARSSATNLLNNIFARNSYQGIWADGVSIQNAYNDVWGNSANYAGLPAGVGDLAVDPLFVDVAAANYRLQAQSPLLNAGHPDAQYNDFDGSRNEMGAYGGPETGVNLSQLAVSVDPPLPTSGKPLKVSIRLINRGAPAYNTALTVDLPNGVTYVEGTGSPIGAFSLTGNRLNIDAGTLGTNSPLYLSFTVQTVAGDLPVALSLPITANWHSGSLTTDYALMLDPVGVYLPMLMR